MSKQRGFTLLELLIAIAVVGVATVSLLGLHARNLRTAARTQDLLVAETLAASLVATSRAGSYPEPGQEEGRFDTERWAAGATGAQPAANWRDRFTWSRNVLSTPLPGLRQVTVAVSLPDSDIPLVELTWLVKQ